MKNDVSFIVGFDMPLYEHQSTFNPNMPVRGLMYYGRLYDQYLSTHHCNRYGKRLVMLPTPSNIVFYNGAEQVEDVVKLKLSDSFTNKEVAGEYEWTVTMININNNHNKQLKDKCKALSDYSVLIGLVREYSLIYGKETGIQKAVDECIERNILSEILIKHKAEVKGREYEIFSSVYEKDYSPQRGAEKMNLSLNEFNERFENWKKNKLDK